MCSIIVHDESRKENINLLFMLEARSELRNLQIVSRNMSILLEYKTMESFKDKNNFQSYLSLFFLLLPME